MAKASEKTKSTVNSEQPEQPARRLSKRQAAKQRVKRRYDLYMPSRKRYRILIWAAFFVFSLIIATQLLYPLDYALPRAQVAKQGVGFYSREQLVELLDKRFRDTKVEIVVDETKLTLDIAALGAEPNTERLIKSITDYPFWQRFIPLSILAHAPIVSEADIYYTDIVLKAALEEQAREFAVPPSSARLAIKNGELVATPEKYGRKVEVDDLYKAITRAQVKLGGTTAVKVEPERIMPEETSEGLRAVQSAAEAALARRIVVRVGEQTFTADKKKIASWLQLDAGKGSRPQLAVAEDKLNEFFDTIDAEAGVKAGQTNITLSDGHEVGRSVGRTGKAIGRADLGAAISAWLLKGEGSGEFEASLHDVAPSVIYNRKYTSTEKGLQAYITDASRRMDVRIAVRQMDGGKWSASARAGESIPSASTYKLFVAKWVFDQIDKGGMKWSDPMLDTTVSGCFDRMIIASTNPCAESWLAKVGRQKFNNYLYGLGFSRGTNFAHPMATHSTVNDLQRMMLGIYDGTIVKGAHRDRLLRSLNSHPFPYGIPAGSAGKVHDKVGFLWDYVHDTSIVYHPKGTYIMTIMTKGQSYATIASLTREIEKIMYP